MLFAHKRRHLKAVKATSPISVSRFKGLSRLTIALALKRFLPYLFLIITLGFLIYFFTSNSLKLTTIDCQLDNRPCEVLQQKLFNKYLNSPLYSLKLNAVEQDLLSFDPSLAAASISVSYPHTLIVRLSSHTNLLLISIYRLTFPSPTPTPTPLPPEATPSASVSTPSALTTIPILKTTFATQEPFKTFSLTKSGSLIDDIKPPDLNTPHPAVFISSDLPTQDQLKNIYEYFQLIQSSSLPFQHFFVLNDSLYLQLNDTTFVIFSLTTTPNSSLASLQQIRAQSTMKLDRVIIDLRFRNPLIINQ